MAAADQMVRTGAGQIPGDFGIMVQRDPPALHCQGGVRSMVMEVGKGRAAAGGYQVLVARIVAIDEMDRTIETMQVAQHKWRDQVAAVEQELSLLLIGALHGQMQIGDMVVGV